MTVHRYSRLRHLSVVELESGISLRRNLAALSSSLYEMAGRMISTILAQGGPHFDVFTPAVAQYLATGTSSAPDIDEIGEFAVRETLKQVSFLDVAVGGFQC